MFLFHGSERGGGMGQINEELPRQLIDEILYFILFSALKQWAEQGKISLDKANTANVAIAEKYKVLKHMI